MRVILTCADRFENCQIFCNCLDWLDSGLIVLLISSEWILGYDCFNWFRLNGFWVIYLAGFLGIEFCFYIWILFLVLHPGRNQSLVLTDSRQCKAKFQRRCGHRLEILTKQWRESGCNKLWFLPGWSTSIEFRFLYWNAFAGIGFRFDIWTYFLDLVFILERISWTWFSVLIFERISWTWFSVFIFERISWTGI